MRKATSVEIEAKVGAAVVPPAVHTHAEATPACTDDGSNGDRPRSRKPAATARVDLDEDVLERLDAGDVRGALDRLMRRHGTTVFRYCREALRDPVLAEDVHQQIFIEAYRDLPRFARRSSLRTWLFGVARHRVLDAAKARTRARGHFEQVEVRDTPDLRADPGTSLDDARWCEAMMLCLDRLNEHVRTALLLRYQQGFTFEEMAEICRESAGTLQARVARALSGLRTCIEAQLGDVRD